MCMTNNWQSELGHLVKSSIRLYLIQIFVMLYSFISRLNTNLSLYESLKKVAENGDLFATDAIDDHVVDLFLFDFEQSGIHLCESKVNLYF